MPSLFLFGVRSLIEGSGHASSCIPIDVILKSVWVYEMHGDVFSARVPPSPSRVEF